jgi:hypothetical protein
MPGRGFCIERELGDRVEHVWKRETNRNTKTAENAASYACLLRFLHHEGVRDRVVQAWKRFLHREGVKR